MRVMVVSGGSRGLGRAVVLAAAREGYAVVFSGRTRSDAMKETEALAGDGGPVVGVEADVRDEDAVDALFDEALDRFDRIDVVVHNASVNRDALLVRTAADTFDDILATNLTGAFLMARRGVMELLGQGEGGRVVNIGSISQEGATSQAAYAASKGGLRGLTRTLAKEVGHKAITANLVVPGLIDGGALSADLPTPLRELMVDRSALRRAGTAEEVAAAVLWLASPGASYVNGAELLVSGGVREIQW